MEYRIYNERHEFLCAGDNSEHAEEILKDSYLEYAIGYEVKWKLAYWNPLNPSKNIYAGDIRKIEK
jgi:hypothetical protein